MKGVSFDEQESAFGKLSPEDVDDEHPVIELPSDELKREFNRELTESTTPAPLPVQLQSEANCSESDPPTPDKIDSSNPQKNESGQMLETYIDYRQKYITYSHFMNACNIYRNASRMKSLSEIDVDRMVKS